jgi:hypothetical protein
VNNIVLETAEKSGATFVYGEGGTVYGMKPAETLFGYTVWAHMIPPFKPEHSLILGYGNGTASELMRRIWGQMKVTGVDLNPKPDYNEYKIKAMDAKEYIWDVTTPKFALDVFRPKFDYVCIDVWNGLKVPEFVFESDFVVRLKEVAKKLVCINVLTEDVPKLKSYHDAGFQFDRSVACENNLVTWWSVKE